MRSAKLAQALEAGVGVATKQKDKHDEKKYSDGDKTCEEERSQAAQLLLQRIDSGLGELGGSAGSLDFGADLGDLARDMSDLAGELVQLAGHFDMGASDLTERVLNLFGDASEGGCRSLHGAVREIEDGLLSSRESFEVRSIRGDGLQVAVGSREKAGCVGKELDQLKEELRPHTLPCSGGLLDGWTTNGR